MIKERIRLEMTIQELIFVMSGSNPGAISVCLGLLENGEKINPDEPFSGISNIFDLDALGIYESRIWMLYKDVCGEHLGNMIAVLHAHQLGQLAGVTTNALNHAIDNRGEGIDIDKVIAAVTKRLPNFKPNTVVI